MSNLPKLLCLVIAIMTSAALSLHAQSGAGFFHNNDLPGNSAFASLSGNKYPDEPGKILSSWAPAITATGTLVSFSRCTDAAAAEQSFTVSGTELTADILLSVPAGYELSLTSGSGFANTLTLTPSAGNVANTIIYIRLAGPAAGNYTGNILLSSTGATDVTIAVNGTLSAPVTANAGPDIPVCQSSGAVIMSGNNPAPGTGTWLQISGPVTANITNATVRNTSVTGLTTPGVYRFSWTITNGSCDPSVDYVDITVNPSPTATITGGDVTVCGSGTTLSAPANLTYNWGRSLTAAPYTGVGNSQTLSVTKSGSYQLTVANEFGCTATSTTTVNVADYVFTGSLVASDAQQTGRLNRFGVVSNCASPKACPGAFTTTGSRSYDSYTVTNPYSTPVCATIGINTACGTSAFAVAYLGSYNPTNLCANYLGDPGSSFPTSGFFEVNIPANATMVVVVHEVNSGTGCANYSLTVDIPRNSNSINVTPGTSVCQGTNITLASNGLANSYLWAPGGASTSSIIVTPADTTQYKLTRGFGNNGCLAVDSVTINVSAPPSVNPVNTQIFCRGEATTPITLTGPVAGTTYSWTNSNPAIGLAASGTGDIPSFTATNNTGAPVSATITVTSSVGGGCTGSSITFPIYIAPESIVSSTTNDDVCATGGTAQLAASGNGVIRWYDALTGGTLLHTGNTFEPNVTATTSYYVENLVPATPTQNVVMPAQSSTFPGNTRGYLFTAPADFVITSLQVPTTASTGSQSIAVVKFNGNTPPPIFSASTNAFTTLFLVQNSTASGNIPVNIPVQAGDVIGILGSRANINSYGPNGSTISIDGQTVGITRLGMQFVLSNSNPRDIWQEPGGNISRIEFTYTLGTCASAPRTEVTANLLPALIATATPVTQTACSGAITPIVLSSNTAGTTYTWTRDNTTSVTGIAASGSGDITGTLTNNTTTAQTVIFTITPTNNGCTGDPITAEVIVQATPTIVCPGNITIANASGLCGSTATYSTTASGIPTPTLSYSFSGATTGSGSGNGSGSFFNVGITTVTVTATNSCGVTDCSFTVTVQDTEAPVITCPAPVTVSCAGEVPAADITAVTASDNCTGTVITHVSDVISNQTCDNRYTITRTYRATDAANNTVTCTQIITVNDQTPPSITCPPAIVVCGAAAVPAADITSVTGVSDNCGGTVTITHVSDVSSCTTCTTTPYTITRTYRATDVCGNYTECTQLITVNPIPTVTTVANQNLCNGLQTTAINFSGPVSGTSYTWTNSNSSIGLAASGTGNIVAFTALNSGTTPVTATISVTPTANGCPGTPGSFTITINPSPVVSLTAFTPVCGNASSFTLTGGSPAGAGGVYFVDGVQQTSFNPTNYTPGVHNIVYQYTNSYSCISTATQTITVYAVPVAGFTVNNNAQCVLGNQFVFTGTSTGASSYAWNFGDGTNSTVVSPVKTYTTPGTYTVTLTATNSNNCAETYSGTITVHPQPAKPTVIPLLVNGVESSVTEHRYNWFVNGGGINNSNTKTLVPQVGGYYQVEVSSLLGGCSTKSDSLFYVPAREFTVGFNGQLAFVYPKPAKNDIINVHFNVPTSTTTHYGIYTNNGQLLMRGVIPQGSRTYQIDVSRYPNAMYVLRLYNDYKNTKGILIPMIR